MNGSISALWQAAGYAIAVAFLFVPILLVRWLMRTRWFRRRKRIRWATPELPLLWERGAMDRLPPPFGDDPDGRRKRR